MIPLIATLRFHHRSWIPLRLWIPLFLVWILLLPLVVILFPVFFIACMFIDVDPFQSIRIFWEILCSLKGTHVEFTEANHSLSFRIH
jgi:hypothetical protein